MKRPVLRESATRYSFWNYPYPRLKHSSTDLPASSKSPLAKPDAEDTSPSSAIASMSTNQPAEPTTMIDTDKLLQPAVSWPTLIVVCIISLLIGSLLRSLLSDADFVIYAISGQQIPVGERWRELRRIFAWRIGWNWDFIVGVARRV